MGLVSPDPGTLFWMTLAFALVVVVLKKFAWKPILNALSERESNIRNALEAAEQAKVEIGHLKDSQAAIRAEAQRDKDQILKEARELKEKIIAEANEKASLDAQRLIEHARDAIEREKLAAIEQIRYQVVSLSVSIAEKIIREKISTTPEQEKVIDLMLQDLNLN